LYLTREEEWLLLRRFQGGRGAYRLTLQRAIAVGRALFEGNQDQRLLRLSVISRRKSSKVTPNLQRVSGSDFLRLCEGLVASSLTRPSLNSLNLVANLERIWVVLQVVTCRRFKIKVLQLTIIWQEMWDFMRE